MNFEKIRKIFENNCQLKKDTPILVGVSGGPDSLCLLELLKSSGYEPVAAVFDHQLRQISAEEVRLVKEFAENLKTPFFSEKMDVRAYAEKHRLSIEEAARTCRYRFLFTKAKELSAQAVAVAHHADDQIETVLMHFLRGSGMTGLRGMAYRQIGEWDQEIPVVRPLLDIWKDEIEAYCLENGFKPVRDESNQDILYFRNRIRNELIPYLGEYNPGIKNVIWRIVDILREDDETLNELTESHWENLKKGTGAGFVVLETRQLQDFSKGLQRRLLRKAISQLRPGLRDISFDSIERVLGFVKDPPRSLRMVLSNGLILLSRDGQLVIKEENDPSSFLTNLPQIGAQDLFCLDIPGELALKDDWVMFAEFRSEKPSDAVMRMTENRFQIFLNADTLMGQIFVRSRRAGDRFDPLGMEGRSQKISDFFINEKMILEARDQWPLVLSGNKIVWIPGYRPAHFCRVTESTRKYLFLKLFKSD